MSETVFEPDDRIITMIDSFIQKHGLTYTEQKFCVVYPVLYKFAINIKKSENHNNFAKEYYEYYFPSLAPRYKNIQKVYENCISGEKQFNFLYHPSEIIYYNWVKNLHNKSDISISNRYCYSQDKKYNDLYEQYVNWNSIVELSELKGWFENFGISISRTCVQFLLENGLPYCSCLIKPKTLFHSTNTGNSSDLIGLLAYYSKQMPHGTTHPLHNSVVLALARLEYFLCSSFSDSYGAL